MQAFIRPLMTTTLLKRGFRPAPSATSSGPASEISLVSGDDFSDRLLVSTSSPLAQQDLVAQTQNGVNMASGTATTAPSTATTAPSTAPLPLTAGLSRQCSLLQDTAPCHTAVYDTPVVYGTPAICCHACLSARLSYPMGYYGQGNQFLLMPNPNWMSVREQMLQHQLLQEQQQFEAWRASQAQPQPQPQPPISSSGLPI